MVYREYFDGRFVNHYSIIDSYLIEWILDDRITNADLRLIESVAKKLDIETGPRSVVDVLYDVCYKLAILEKEVVSPETIMKRIKELD